MTKQYFTQKFRILNASEDADITLKDEDQEQVIEPGESLEMTSTQIPRKPTTAEIIDETEKEIRHFKAKRNESESEILYHQNMIPIWDMELEKLEKQMKKMRKKLKKKKGESK